ncbi:MaoC family dehydratase [Peribacillus frigoritolerans]|uniref:MaoC family dehydratase n=1 Tax=Peribacillus frigoritolerans TaxID=450367 RepID=UPI0020BF4A3E|nr:MaoC/PaaZ C-terminal domain-containing protein [Peribacillus frigoritolerans]
MFFEDLYEGYTFPTIIKESITRVQLVKFAGASGDFNPLHTVEEVGKQAGTGIIAHGMLIMGMASQGVTSWILRKYVNKMNVRFRKMTFPGEEIQVTGKIIEIKESNKVVGEVVAMNAGGEVKVAGIFEATLPSR